MKNKIKDITNEFLEKEVKVKTVLLVGSLITTGTCIFVGTSILNNSRINITVNSRRLHSI